MNRIVKRNGAAPPWIELQKELDDALDSFRRVLTETWVRRASRMLTLNHPPSTLRKLTAEQASRFRDSEWESRESAYHDKAIEGINGLVRKYNGLAPYTVRRTYVTKQQELDRCFLASGEEIIGNFKGSYGGSQSIRATSPSEDEEGLGGGALGKEDKPVTTSFSLRQLVLRWMSKLSGNRIQL